MHWLQLVKRDKINFSPHLSEILEMLGKGGNSRRRSCGNQAGCGKTCTSGSHTRGRWLCCWATVRGGAVGISAWLSYLPELDGGSQKEGLPSGGPGVPGQHPGQPACWHQHSLMESLGSFCRVSGFPWVLAKSSFGGIRQLSLGYPL